MAEEHHDHDHHIHHVEEKSGECDIAAPIKTEEAAVETKDRGLFGFMGKKEECEEKKPQAEEVDVIVTEFDKVQVSEPEPKVEEHKEDEEKKHGLLEKLHRSGSSSSSSSSDEEDGGEKKKKEKKKKGLKEKILGEKKEEEDTSVPIEKCEEVAVAQPEEKKGFLEKIKEKLPGQHKKAEEPGVVAPPPPPVVVECYAGEEGDQPKEKKGFLEKIKEKIPGYHPKTSTNEEEKEVSPRDVTGGLPGPQVTGGLP